MDILLLNKLLSFVFEMNEPIDYKKFVKVKYNWQSNVDGMDIEDLVVARLQQLEDETAEM